MLSRVAENVFWLSRYLERVESTARLMHVHGNVVMDVGNVVMDVDEGTDGMDWMPLVSISGMDTEFFESYANPTEENVCHFLLFDKKNPGSMLNAMAAIHHNLRSSRDTLPRRLYESITNLHLMIKTRSAEGIDASQRQSFLKSVEQKLLAIAGILEGSLRHDLGYLIMRMGCYVERADMTSRILDVRGVSLSRDSSTSELLPFENRGWVSVLDSVHAVQMYRMHVRKPVHGPDVLAFLLRDPGLPRSYQFCLDHLDRCLQQLNKNEAPLAALQQVKSLIHQADIQTLARDTLALHQFLDVLQISLSGVTDAIANSYFPPRIQSS